jgi:hypothetical protein
VSAPTTGRQDVDPADPWAHGTRRHGEPFWDSKEIGRQFVLTATGGQWKAISCLTRASLAAAKGPLEILSSSSVPGVAHLVEWGVVLPYNQLLHGDRSASTVVLADLVAEADFGGRCWHAAWVPDDPLPGEAWEPPC